MSKTIASQGLFLTFADGPAESHSCLANDGKEGVSSAITSVNEKKNTPHNSPSQLLCHFFKFFLSASQFDFKILARRIKFGFKHFQFVGCVGETLAKFSLLFLQRAGRKRRQLINRSTKILLRMEVVAAISNLGWNARHLVFVNSLLCCHVNCDYSHGSRLQVSFT